MRLLYWEAVPWVLGGLILVTVGAVTRRLLHFEAEPGRPRGLTRLDAERHALYQAVALEVETQAAILGVSLNDAFEERDAGHDDIAWRLVQLSLGEWDRLANLVAALLRVVSARVNQTRVVAPFHGIVAHQFKSALMVNYVRMHELLDQLVFGFGLRFQLHLRVLRRAAETLTGEFRRRYRSADRNEDRSDEFWRQLDFYYHDFDLISKEVVLAFRALLASLPQDTLQSLGRELRIALGRGVRAPCLPVDHPS